MPSSRNAKVAPSLVSLVLAKLVERDDFMRAADVAAAVGVPTKRVRPALWWLQKAGAIQAIEAGGFPHFFATPESDHRRHTVDEKREEDLPRRAQRRRGGWPDAKTN